MKDLHIADLFCGAGGTSAGAMEAIEALGFTPQLTAINHWDVAIATHTANHPNQRHLCTSIDNIDPRHLFKPGQLKVLWASPECTHHSVARGGKPINDQSRATAWCVVRWAEALQPEVILVENVPEFESWGAIGTNGRPMKTKRGATFLAWVNALDALGYRVDWRILCAADYGDPTTRRRLFVQCVRGRRKIVWPNPTHGAKNEADLFGSRRPWVSAREIIDWNLPGQSIYERKRPLSPKTMRRIMAGLEKFGLKPFIVPQQSNPVPKGVDEPLGTVVAEGSGPKLAEPFILTMEHGGSIRSADRPLPTVTCAKGGAMAVVDPYLVKVAGAEDRRPRSVDEPHPTVTAGGVQMGIAQPFIVRLQHNNSADAVDKPLGTVCAGGTHFGLAEPYLVEMKGTSTARSIEKPAPGVTTKQHLALAEPYLINTAHSGERRHRSIEEPMPAVAGNRGDMALVEPFVISAGGPECGARGVSHPLGTVLTRDHRALVEPALLPQQSGGVLRPVSEPVPTVATGGAVGLVEPFLVEYYGNGNAESVENPLNTVTCKDRHALVRPTVIIDGERYLLDIRFRMLQPKELAAAQGFRSDYQFTGTKTEQVKQIGNAVPRNLARALCLAALSQESDITPYLPKEAAVA